MCWGRTLFEIIILNHARLCHVSKKPGFIHSTKLYDFVVVVIKERNPNCLHNIS